MQSKKYLEQLLHIEGYKKALEEYRNKTAEALEDTRKRVQRLYLTELSERLEEDYKKTLISIDEDIIKLIMLQKNALTLINKLEDDTLKAVLLLRYVHEKKWADIAEAIHCTPSYAHRLHNKALKILDQL